MCYFISKHRKDTIFCQMFSPESKIPGWTLEGSFFSTWMDFRGIFFSTSVNSAENDPIE